MSTMTVTVFLAVLYVTCPPFVMGETEHTYITDTGMTCHQCPPGYIYKDDCKVPNTIAVCEPCPADTFSSTYNRAIYCHPCKSHCEMDILVTVQKCNSTTDMVCDCPSGMIMENRMDKYRTTCKPFQGCEPGSGVLVQGTTEHEPECANCRPDITFSPEMSPSEPCYPCTQCPHGDVWQECNVTHDSICNPPRQPWYEDAAVTSLIVNGCLVLVILLLIIKSVLIAKIRRYFQKATGERPVDVEECRLTKIASSNNSSDSGLDRSSDQLEMVQPLIRASSVTWTPILQLLSSSRLISDWKNVIRSLFHEIGVRDGDSIIQEIIHDNSSTVKEQIYQCLVRWKQRGSSQSTYILVRVLTEANFHDVVQTLKTQFPSEFPTNPGTT